MDLSPIAKEALRRKELVRRAEGHMLHDFKVWYTVASQAH